MVRAKGKANASTKRSVSKADVAIASEADTTLDSSEVENHIETGGSVAFSVETAVTEETMITLVEEEEENDGAETETLEGEHAMEEEENDGAETETLEGEHAMEEDEDNKENEVFGGGDEKCGSDKEEEEDAISNDEGNNQENTIEQEDGEQNIDDKQVGDAAGVDKDNQEDDMPKQEDETNANEKNKEKIEGSLNQKAKKMKRRNNRKRKANGSPQEKGENNQVMKKVASNGKVGKDLGKLESNDDEQSSKKVASGGKSRAAPQGKDEPESSHKKLSSKKKAKGMGMIFMCNSETKKDCYRYKVLGLPASKKETVEKIYKGMRLFLYDVDLKLMYGIYKAAERGGYNIAPKAFKSQFPSQVRFSVLEDCLPLAEETFRQAIKKNYFTRSKFDCLLSSEQVKDLCKLFTAASKGSRSKDTRLGFETPAKSKRDRVKRRGRDGRRRAERARRPERVEERGYRERVEERGYRERVEERVYHERPHFHERDLVTSPLVPLAPLQPLPPPAPVQSYAYSRTLRTDPYRRDTVIQHDDTYRQSRLVELPDAYRRDTVLGNPDVYRRQAVVEPRETVLGNPDVYRRQAVVELRDYYRQDGFPERREYHQPLSLETRLRDDIGINDPYVSYRERVSYHDPVNSARSEPEYDPPPVGLRSVYRHGGTRSVLPEYHSSAASSLYEYPRQPQYRY
ncbi:uncharacterized protein LOC107829231 [Nicotiana tabacum]|uniref:Uncharacterized protein LOC107829231 n=2 Tax=Nicotiana TaxID=4085 RepID=A0AC58U774_TOBAC|nr:PREDICTED: uncharacterized protein LOC104229847 isoform X1 [Nicotiana sylvestris]XP_009780868.1 PREDICTED: uncharacterized protein LOC104229847 isoform X1 [Nicotiana sylvestris]XP_009780869.1 PREDICTED: uncharacterized protein LOC104229847 isoform X1 [Nicotiana sylvestris]